MFLFENYLLLADYNVNFSLKLNPWLEDSNYCFYSDFDNDGFDDIIMIKDFGVQQIRNDNGLHFSETSELFQSDSFIDFADFQQFPESGSKFLFLKTDSLVSVLSIDGTDYEVRGSYNCLLDKTIYEIKVIKNYGNDSLIVCTVYNDDIIVTSLTDSTDFHYSLFPSSPGNTITDVYIGNIDSDSFQEMVFSTEDSLYVGNMSNDLIYRIGAVSDSAGFESISVVDFDENSIFEILSCKNGRLYWFNRDESSGYEFTDFVFNQYSGIEELYIADFSGDGADDIVIEYSDTLTAFLKKNGLFYVESGTIELGEYEEIMNFADLNHDGRENPIIRNYDDEYLEYIEMSDQDFNLRKLISSRRFEFKDIEVIEGDNNKVLEVYCMNNSGLLRIDVQNSDLTVNPQVFNADDVLAYTVADFDGSSITDLVYLKKINDNTADLVIEYDDGKSSVLRSAIQITDSDLYKISAADIDDDSDDDIAFYNSNSGDISGFVNVNGSFTENRYFTICSNSGNSFEFADIGGDGLKDVIFFSSEESQENSLFLSLNEDGLSFSDAVRIDYFLNFQEFGVADVNYDTLPDLVIIKNNRMFVRFGNRSENGFQNFNNYICDSDGLIINPIIDVDSDNDKDILCHTDYNGEFNVALVENSSYSTFWDAQNIQILDNNKKNSFVCMKDNSDIGLLKLDSFSGKLCYGVVRESSDNQYCEITECIDAQCYPNPFNPETVLQYSIEKDNDVEISIYNIKGQRVKSLLKEFSYSGIHSVIWNGTNDNNVKVSSGVYFYKISSGSNVTVGKVVLMK